MKKQNDEDVKKLLSNLPSIEDRQSKDALYNHVTSRMSDKKKRVAPWLLPGMATVSVLLLLAVFIPVFLNSNQMFTVEESQDHLNSASESSPSQEESSSGESPSAAEEDTEEEQEARPQESDQTEKDAPESTDIQRDEESGGVENEAPEEDSLPFDSFVAGPSAEKLNTLAYVGMNGGVIIPLTMSSKDANTLELDSLGLAERSTNDLQYSIDEETKQATVTFPDEFNGSGSTWTQAIIESVRWELHDRSIKTIDIRTSSGEAVPLGNYGEMKEIPVIKNEEYIFKIYQYEESEVSFLVPIAVDGDPSFRQALEMMQDKGEEMYVTPAIPSHVQFPSVSESDEGVIVEVEHSAWASEQQLLTMIEAVLATAGQFGYDEVHFEGINVRTFSAYDLNGPIRVPSKINPIKGE